jgi:hypothetical protein
MRLALGVAATLAVAVTPSAVGKAKPAVPAFRHVVVVVLENKESEQVAGNRAAPQWNRFAAQGARLTRYFAVAHPSLPNYLALVSGSTQGVTTNCTSCSVDARSLADTLESAGKSWKTYAEGLPAPGWLGASAGRYAKKHDPFLYFRDVASRVGRRERVVPLPQLGRDLRAHRLPDFSLVVPNLCHSTHDCSVSTGDAWLGRFLRSLLSSRELDGSVVFVVFDEGLTSREGGGHVAALAVGPAVLPGSRSTKATTHYGLLRTVEDAWQLPRLGRSAGAKPVTGIWR